MDLIEVFKKEWPVISQAPWSVATLVFVVATLSFLFSRWVTSGQLATKQERLDLANDRVTDYERKLSGASPDEASAKIATLESRIVALEPYHLNADQLSRLHDTLVAAKYGARITRASTSPRPTQDWVTVSAPKPPNKDVTLAFNENVPLQYVDAVRAALKSAKVDYGEQKVTDEPSLTFPVIWLASARTTDRST